MSRLPFSRKSWILPRCPLMKEPSVVHHKTVKPLRPLSLLNQPPLLGLVRFSSQPNFSATYPDLTAYVFKIGGPSPTAVSYNTMILRFIKRMDLNNAIRLLSLMKGNGCKPNECTYGELILGFHKVGEFDTASALLLEMLEQGLMPKKFHYTCLIDGLCKDGKVEAALVLLEKMEAYGCRPETEAYNSIISCFYIKNRFLEAQELFEKTVQKEVFPDLINHTALVDGLCRNGDVGLAFKELKAMEKKMNCMLNLVLYGSLTYGLCLEGRADEAKMLLEEMERKGIVLNAVVYTSLIDGYASLNRVDDAFSILGRMVDRGFEPKYSTFRVLMKVLENEAPSSKVRFAANKLLVKMSEYGCEPTVDTYTTIVGGLYEEGETIEAAELWKKMEQKGLSPDDGYMYAPLIAAHCRNLKLYPALELFDSIIKKGLEPHVKSYTALICGLCKTGELFKAVTIYKDLVYRRWDDVNKIVWEVFIDGLVGVDVNRIVWEVFIDGLLEEVGVDACSDFTHEVQSHDLIPESETYVMLEEQLSAVDGSSDHSKAVDKLKLHLWDHLWGTSISD